MKEYRAINKKTKEWAYGPISASEGETVVLNTAEGDIECIGETLCLKSNKKDRLGNDIYDKDVVIVFGRGVDAPRGITKVEDPDTVSVVVNGVPRDYKTSIFRVVASVYEYDSFTNEKKAAKSSDENDRGSALYLPTGVEHNIETLSGETVTVPAGEVGKVANILVRNGGAEFKLYFEKFDISDWYFAEEIKEYIP